jgi:hypothetical protein
VKIEKQRLGNQLFEIQRIKSKEIEEYQSQLSALDEQLQLERQQHEESISYPAFTIFRHYHFSKNIFYYQFYTSQFLILTLKHFTN